MTSFDSSRLLKQPDLFARFDVSVDGVQVSATKFSDSAELIVFERHGERRALLVQEMAYHHLAQGTLADQNYVVSFCGVCHSGVGMTPTVNGEVYHFQAGGLYNGVAILTDDETGTYWDHITGKAVYGPMEGVQLEIWSLEITTVAAARIQEPDLRILQSHQRPVFRRAMHFGQRMFGQTGFLPKQFTETMAEEDSRLPRMTMGLGIIVDEVARFYPLQSIAKSITEDLNGQKLRVCINPANGFPVAQWENGTQPLQYFLRWYGFALTFPHCSVYEQ